MLNFHTLSSSILLKASPYDNFICAYFVLISNVHWNIRFQRTLIQIDLATDLFLVGLFLNLIGLQTGTPIISSVSRRLGRNLNGVRVLSFEFYDRFCCKTWRLCLVLNIYFIKKNEYEMTEKRNGTTLVNITYINNCSSSVL